MKKLSLPVLILLAVVCLVALSNWRNARSSLQTTNTDLLSTSNKLAEITAQLATKAAAVETLRITQNLHADDLTTLSNRLGTLAAELEKARTINRQTSEEVRQRESDLAISRGETRKLQRVAEDLRAETVTLQAQLVEAETKIKLEKEHGEALTGTINELQSEKARFIQHWNDPASLRAQLTVVDQARAVSAGIRSAAKSNKLALQADGSVTNVPFVFKVVPGPSTPPR